MMRNFIKTILVSLMLILSTNIQAKKPYDWSKVIDAIIQVESKGNPNARNPIGDCCGILQITPTLVRDVNEYLKMKKSKKRYTLADRYNVQKSKEMFILYQERYNKTNDVEKAIRLWNGGCGYSVAKTNKYLNNVMRHYKGGK